MKPEIEYRPQRRDVKPKGKLKSPSADGRGPGKWVWLCPDQIIAKRPQRREYMRTYMQAYRKKAKKVKACG